MYVLKRIIILFPLPITRIPRYKHLKSILASNQDVLYAEGKKAQSHKPTVDKETCGYVRGAAYYGGMKHD